MTTIVRDKFGRNVPLVRPKQWKEQSVRRSRERSERIAQARKQQTAWQTTTEWMNSVDGQAIAGLEAQGIPWAAVQRWLDEIPPRDAFAARMLLKQVLLVLSDDQASPKERFEVRRELYRRLIAAGIVD